MSDFGLTREQREHIKAAMMGASTTATFPPGGTVTSFKESSRTALRAALEGESTAYDIVIALDSTTQEMLFSCVEVNAISPGAEGGAEMKRHRFGIAMSSLGLANDPSRVVADMLYGSGLSPHMQSAIFDVWVSLCAATGASLGQAKPGPVGEPIKFPETAEPVLARLEAEVGMCSDPMQKSRLEAILASLKKHSPDVASGT